jgi:hypothetical protein
MIMIMIFPFGVPKVVLSNLIYYYFSTLSLSRSTTHRKTEQLTDNKAKEPPEFNLTIHPSRRTRTLDPILLLVLAIQPYTTLLILNMVVVEAAAITACGVAAYKGGKEATIATIKSVKTKLNLTKKEKSNRETCEQRKLDRKERFAKVNEYRNSITTARNEENGIERSKGGLAPSFNWKSDSNNQTRSSTSSGSWRGK